MKLVSTFSERLKEALGGESLTDFANKIKVSKQTISAYVNGVRKPKAPMIKVMAEALSVNEAWLLGYDTPKFSIHDHPELYNLSEAEKRIIHNFRSLIEGGREMSELTLGQRIVLYRNKKSMLQKELAVKVGITPTALNYYEKDKREPNVMIIKKIADTLEITGDELLGLPERPEPVNLSKEEKQLIQNLRSLNEEGREKVAEYIDDIMRSGKYIKNNAHGMAKEEEA